MKEKTILIKVILILIMGVFVFSIPARAFATTSGAADLDDLLSDYEDQGKKEDLTEEESKADTSKEETTTTNTNTTNNNTTDTNKTTTTTNSTNKETTNNNIPKAGIEENTMGIVTIVVLGITAVYAYKKIKEFKNI